MSQETLSARVYHEILGRMLGGALVPGQAFNRRQLAAELGVSVAPVLEAVLALEAEGLIETVSRQGTRVRRFTLEDVRGQLTVREALECQAARLYCGAPLRPHAQRLRRLAKQIDASVGRSPAKLRKEIRFHRDLVALAGVRALTEAYERVMKLGLLFAVQALHPDPTGAPRSPHVPLLATLLRTGPDEAEAAIRQHVRCGTEAFFGRVLVAEPAAAVTRAPAWLSD